MARRTGRRHEGRRVRSVAAVARSPRSPPRPIGAAARPAPTRVRHRPVAPAPPLARGRRRRRPPTRTRERSTDAARRPARHRRDARPTGPKIVAHQVSSAAQAARRRDRGRARATTSSPSTPTTVVRPIGAPTNDPDAASQWALDPTKTIVRATRGTPRRARASPSRSSTPASTRATRTSPARCSPGHEFLNGTIDRDALDR